MTDLGLQAAHGEMAMQVRAPVQLVWRNDAASASPGRRPQGLDAEPLGDGRLRPRQDYDRRRLPV